MEKILIIEDIDTIGVIVEKIRSYFGNGIEFHKTTLEIVLNSKMDGRTLLVNTLQALGKNKQEVMDTLEVLSRQDKLRLLVGEVPETLKDKPNMIVVISQCYRRLAYTDYNTRIVNQKKKLSELKGDGEKIKGYGRPNKITMQDFYSTYIKVLNHEISNAEAQKQLNLSKRSYYNYKNNMK